MHVSCCSRHRPRAKFSKIYPPAHPPTACTRQRNKMGLPRNDPHFTRRLPVTFLFHRCIRTGHCHIASRTFRTDQASLFSQLCLLNRVQTPFEELIRLSVGMAAVFPTPLGGLPSFLIFFSYAEGELGFRRKGINRGHVC